MGGNDVHIAFISMARRDLRIAAIPRESPYKTRLLKTTATPASSNTSARRRPRCARQKPRRRPSRQRSETIPGRKIFPAGLAAGQSGRNHRFLDQPFLAQASINPLARGAYPKLNCFTEAADTLRDAKYLRATSSLRRLQQQIVIKSAANSSTSLSLSRSWPPAPGHPQRRSLRRRAAPTFRPLPKNRGSRFSSRT